MDSNNGNSPDPVKSFWTRVREDMEFLLRHVIAMGSAILSMWGTHLLMKWTVGEADLFYGFVPISYIVQTGDLLVIARFFRQLVREI